MTTNNPVQGGPESRTPEAGFLASGVAESALIRADKGTRLPKGVRRRTPRCTVPLCLLALAGASVSLGVQSTPFQEWRLARQPLPGLLRELQRRGESPPLLYYIGLRLNQQQQFLQADGYLRQAVGLNPESPRLRDEWARALLGSGQTTAALGELREFAGTHPDVAAGHKSLGKFYFTQRSMKRAAEEFERAGSITPDDAETWAYLSAAADSLGNLRRAQQAARQAVTLRPRNAGYHLLLASYLSRTQQPDAAQQEYQRAIALGPRSAAAHQQYAEWLLDAPTAAERTRAVSEARQAIALDGTEAGPYLVLGRALIYQGERMASIAPLTRAAALAPDDPAAALALARVHHALNHRAETQTWQRIYIERQRYLQRRHALQEAVVLQPEASAPKRRLAHLLGMHGDVDECVHHYAMAMHRHLDAAPVLIAASRDLMAGGHAALAVPLARRVVEMNEKNPEASEVYGDALLGIGAINPAIEQYNQTLKLQPNRASILRARLQRFTSAHPELRLAIIAVPKTPAAASKNDMTVPSGADR